MKTYKIGKRIKDREGNEFVIREIDFKRCAVTIRGQGGEKEIDIEDLKFYQIVS